MSSARYGVIVTDPVPLIIIESPPPLGEAHWLLGCFQDVAFERAGLTRGTSLNRLPVVLSTGTDVEPPTDPFYAASPDKAMGYGEPDGVVVQFLDVSSLDHSWKIFQPDEQRPSDAELELEFPVQERLSDASLFCSRFPQQRFAGTGNDRLYGWWNPSGCPWDALRGIIVIGPRMDPLFKAVVAAMVVSECAGRTWTRDEQRALLLEEALAASASDLVLGSQYEVQVGMMLERGESAS